MSLAADAQDLAPGRRFALRPLAGLLLAALCLTAAFAFGLTRLSTSAGIDLLTDTSSPAFAKQGLFASTFGADPVVIVVQAPPKKALLTGPNMIALATLEGQLARKPGVKVVYGPGTLVNTFATEVTNRALAICSAQGKAAQQSAQQSAARRGASAQAQQSAGQSAFDAAVKACAQQLATQYGQLGIPALNNPSFFDAVLLEPGGSWVRPFWTWALPDPGHAVISVRMAPGASLADVRSVVALAGSSASAHGPLKGLRVTTSGVPALTAALAGRVTSSLALLLPITLAAMVLVTLVVLRVRHRLIAVPLAALAGVWAAGAAGLAGLALTPATLAVIPVVLGLATDYSLQSANRLAEEQEGGAGSRVWRVARAMLPPTGMAAVATAAGVLAFAISPIPLVRQFALFLALGVAMAWLVSVLVGLPLLAGLAAAAASDRLPRWLSFAARPLPPPSWGWLAKAGRAPLAVLVPLALAGLAGWAALPRVAIETDPSHLLPAGSPALAQAARVARATGAASELDLVLAGPDTSSPAAVRWLARADRLMEGADHGTVRNLTGLPAFLSTFNEGKLPGPATTARILARVPPYFSKAVISGDHKLARSVYGTSRLTSVADDARLARRLRSLPPPPAGYHAYAAGMAVIAASALASMESQQLWLNLAALGLVLAVLLVAYRRPLPALLAVLPTAVAAGWATGALFLLGGRTSPITVLLAGVVVAFATEFSVLWLSRYRSELASGGDPDGAAAAASRRIGPAVVASALALACGFLLLGVSPVPMVRDFGIWSGADLLLAAAAVLTLLPAAARRLWRPSA